MFKSLKLLLQLAATGFGVSTIYFFKYHLLIKPERRSNAKGDKNLDPIGGSTKWKNMCALLMAKISAQRERKKSNVPLKTLEDWHEAENHPFFNESHYINAIDPKTGSRVIFRISHRGRHGKKMYVFLLVHDSSVGNCSIEVDDVVWTEPNGGGLVIEGEGVRYECLQPMKSWRLSYEGLMKIGCSFGSKRNAEKFKKVKIDFVYKAETKIYWYMRDEYEHTLGKNLAQEPWDMTFVKYCLNRSSNHGHYEDYGALSGSINKKSMIMDTFRDHSWDIRTWAGIDQLFLLLLCFEEPLTWQGFEYHFFNLTLVNMPGNKGGLSRYSTGYILSKDTMAPLLNLKYATSILDIKYHTNKDGTREPMGEDFIETIFRSNDQTELKIDLGMKNVKNRLMYWPDKGSSQVFEDSMDFNVEVQMYEGKKSIKTCGTRQTAFRIGEFDPSFGGVG